MALQNEDPLADQPKIPVSGRPIGDPRKSDGKKGDENNHGAILNGGQHIHDLSKDKAGGKPAQKADTPTVGSQKFDSSKNPVDFIKKFDPKNIAGSIPFALDLSQKIQQGLNPQSFVKDLLGSKLTGLMGQLSQVSNMLQQAQGMLPAQVQQLTQMQQQLTSKITSELSGVTQAVSSVTDVATKIQTIQSDIQQISEQPNNTTTV